MSEDLKRCGLLISVIYQVLPQARLQQLQILLEQVSFVLWIWILIQFDAH